MTRLEQRKNSVEKTLKDFKIPYETMYDRRYFKITYQGHKLLLEVIIALFLFVLPISKIIFPGVSKKYPSF